MKNVSLRPYPHASSFRKLAAAAWVAPREPNVYGSIAVRAAPLVAWLERQSEQEGIRVTVTHAVVRAVAMVLARHPDANGFVRFGQLVLREHVDVYVHVLLREPVGGTIGGADLSGLCLRHADRLTPSAIARELHHAVDAKRQGRDPELVRTRRDTAWMPGWLLRLGLRLAELLQYGLNLRTDWLGIPRDPVGSAEVSSVGMFGIQTAYGPFFPLSRNAIAVVAGAVEDAVVAVDGQPVVTPMLTLNATFDHRVIDGFHAAVLTREVRQLLEHPELLDLDPADTRVPDARATITVGRAAPSEPAQRSLAGSGTDPEGWMPEESSGRIIRKNHPEE